MLDLKKRYTQWMQGRYGENDKLNLFLLCAFLVLIVIAALLQFQLLDIPAFVALIYAYYRILSKNIEARVAENRKFEIWLEKVFGVFQSPEKKRERRIYRIFPCPQCGQKLRIPKGHGKVSVTCPKCHKEFMKRS